MDSARALSCASPTVPIDASIPASRRRSVNRTDVYWLPASLLNRNRFNNDYAEVLVKPRNHGLARWRGFAHVVPRLNVRVLSQAVEGLVNPPGESGDSMLIETMLPHRYSNRYRRFLPISRAAYLRSIHTSADC